MSTGHLTTQPVRRLPAGWQMYLFFGLYPVLWVLGLSYFLWPAMAVVFCASLCLRRPVRVPPGFGLWGLFLLWMLASVIELDSSQRLMFFGWRALIYVTATALLLWVYNASEDELPSDAVAGALTCLWAVSILGGLVGVFYPELSFHSLAQQVLPKSILSNPTVYAYVHPALAEMQFKALGHPIGRPMTFYAYTNQWAAAVGVLTPFAIITAMRARRRFTRHLVIALLAVAAIPVVISINRGLWIALGVALVFVTVKMTATGRSRVLLAVLGLCTVVAAVIVLSPLGGIIHERLTSQRNSNGTRSTLYQEAFSGVGQSPAVRVWLATRLGVHQCRECPRRHPGPVLSRALLARDPGDALLSRLVPVHVPARAAPETGGHNPLELRDPDVVHRDDGLRLPAGDHVRGDDRLRPAVAGTAP